MDKTISSSCYDAIVIKQQNRTYRSTPFQVVFSSNLIKQIEKNIGKNKTQPYKLSLTVNNKLVDIPIKIDENGRVVFQLAYTRKMSHMVSDSSDVSDEDHSNKSSNTLDTKISKNKGLQEKLQEYKNQQAPSKFWQFAWLFNHKKDQNPPPNLYKIQEDQNNPSNLTKIKEQIYQGEQHSKEPLFHLSLCGNLLKKKQTKEQILKTFYDNRVDYSHFIRDPPGILNDSNLVVKFDDSIYTWQLGVAILTCRFAYGRDLKKQQIQDIVKTKFTKSRLFSFISGGSNITKLDITQYQDLKQIKKKQRQQKRIRKAQKPLVRYKKTPDTEIIRKMKLKYGKNIGKFQLDVGEGSKQTITMKIFLWDHSEKIIISDIDGTITKSDILGQILNKWIHTGVTKLFTEIYKRHYKIIYLTARAIGQYQQTSKFLETVEQQNVFLPEGPLLMSPNGYMRSFTREVIYKTPDYLKTKLLATLNQIFPNTKNPIYCGFGNRETDSTAYSKINIAPDKIFCITEKSIISRQSDKQFNSTYKDILANINDFFPEYFKDNAMVDSSSEDSEIQEYHAVTGNKQVKKSQSVDGGDRLTNLSGYQLDQLSPMGNLSESRKSEHQISDIDLKQLEYMKRHLTTDLVYYENDNMIKIIKKESEKIEPKHQISISDTIVEQVPPGSPQKIVEQVPPGSRTPNNELSAEDMKMKEISKQQLQNMLMQQLKQENEVEQNTVIQTNEDQSKSIDNQSKKSYEDKSP